jgi:hypothetical protein
VYPQVLWAYKLYAGADFSGVAFTYTSHDGDSGYPGTLTVTADYRLTASNALHMTFSATTDKATVVNICNHTCACEPARFYVRLAQKCEPCSSVRWCPCPQPAFAFCSLAEG